jgi:hypothetical protein
MNERIQELAEQAVLQANEVFDQKGKDYPGIVMEKFAELIVQECQTVVEWAISVDSTIDRVPVLIKEHFGLDKQTK